MRNEIERREREQGAETPAAASEAPAAPRLGLTERDAYGKPWAQGYGHLAASGLATPGRNSTRPAPP